MTVLSPQYSVPNDHEDIPTPFRYLCHHTAIIRNAFLWYFFTSCSMRLPWTTFSTWFIGRTITALVLEKTESVAFSYRRIRHDTVLAPYRTCGCRILHDCITNVCCLEFPNWYHIFLLPHKYQVKSYKQGGVLRHAYLPNPCTYNQFIPRMNHSLTINE